MGDTVRRRVALWLGLGRLWVELDALSTRVRLLEQDAEDARAAEIDAYAGPPTGVSRSPASTASSLPDGLFESTRPNKSRGRA